VPDNVIYASFIGLVNRELPWATSNVQYETDEFYVCTTFCGK